MKIGVVMVIVFLISISSVGANNIFFSPETVYQDKFVLQQLSLPKLFFSSPFFKLNSLIIVKETLKEIKTNLEDNSVNLVQPKLTEIIISEEVFQFETVTINVGQKVVWKNGQKRLPVLLNGVREISAMKSGNLQSGDSFSWKFSKPGEYTYVDSVMIGRVGKIVVNP